LPSAEKRSTEPAPPDSHDPNLLGFQWDKYTRLFAFHAPVHSAILAGLHSVGVDWVSGYRILKAVGVAVLVAGTG
jgi:hypothetical protein